MKTFCRLFVSVFVVLLAGCGGSGDGDGSTPISPITALKRMNIAGADTLILSKGTSSNKTGKANAPVGTQSSNTLYKLTSDGLLIEIEYFDEDENKLGSESFSPTYVENINGNYLFVKFVITEGAPSEEFFVRKSDGAVFKSGTQAVDASTAFLGKKTLFFSEKNHKIADGNFYYLRRKANDARVGLVKVDISNPESLFNIDISPAVDDIGSMRVVIDKHGNAIYSAQVGNTFADRLVKLDGSLESLASIPGNSSLTPFLSPAGDAFVTRGPTIYEIRVNANGDITTPVYGSVGVGDISETFIHTDTRVLSVGTGGSVLEVFNATGTPHQIANISGLFTEINGLGVTKNNYYLFGNGTSGLSIYRIDINTDTPVLMLDSSKFSIFKMEISASDKIIFHAVRLSDGVNVTGQIESPNQVTILSELDNRSIVQLERVL